MNIPPAKLRKARKANGISERQVSLHLGINTHMLQQFENGKIELGNDLVERYWKYLTVELKIKIRL